MVYCMKNISTDKYRPGLSIKISFSRVMSKAFFLLSAGSSKQKNTETLILQILLLKLSVRNVSISLCMSIHSLQAVLTSLRLMRDKITSPQLSSS